MNSLLPELKFIVKPAKEFKNIPFAACAEQLFPVDKIPFQASIHAKQLDNGRL